MKSKRKNRATIKNVALSLMFFVILSIPFFLERVIPSKEEITNNLSENMSELNKWKVVEKNQTSIRSVRFEEGVKETPIYRIDTEEGIYRTPYKNLHHIYFTDEESYFTVKIYEKKDADSTDNEKRAKLSLYLNEEDFLPLNSYFADQYGRNLLFEKVNPRNNGFYNQTHTILKGSWEEELFLVE